MSIPRAKVPKAKKVLYTLRGGPWDGGTVSMSDSTTLVFRVRGFVGRYINGKWSDLND